MSRGAFDREWEECFVTGEPEFHGVAPWNSIYAARSKKAGGSPREVTVLLDPPDWIEQCLSCPYEECVNCFKGKPRRAKKR